MGARDDHLVAGHMARDLPKSTPKTAASWRWLAETFAQQAGPPRFPQQPWNLISSSPQLTCLKGSPVKTSNAVMGAHGGEPHRRPLLGTFVPPAYKASETSAQLHCFCGRGKTLGRLGMEINNFLHPPTQRFHAMLQSYARTAIQNLGRWRACARLR